MAEAGTQDEVREVPAADWHQAVERVREDGNTWFDMLTAVDEIGRSDDFRIVLRVARPGQPQGVRLQTRVSRDGGSLPTVADLFPGAAWHEREVHDFFGVTFTGGADDAMRPLLNHDRSIRPLRKEFVLAARSVTPWPGAKEPGESVAAPSRRRMVPPGVPDAAVWGDRDGSLPPAGDDEIAAAVAGGRVRRRR